MTKATTSSIEPWYYDEEAAERGVQFFSHYLTHVKGHLAGRPFTLLPWQADDIIRPLFGRLRNSDSNRVIRTAYIEMGAKNGKSPIGSGIALQGLFADREYGAEVYSVAGAKGQAGIIFNVAADMVEANPKLAKRAKVYRSRIAHHGVIYVPKTESVYKVISADVALNDGINASRVVFDEVHRQPSRELWDLMQKSGIARQQPLLVGFTTAGVDDETTLAKQEHDYALQVRNGLLDDPTYLAVLWHNDPDAVWDNEDTWRRSNPGLGTRKQVKDGTAILAIEDIRSRVTKLRESPAELLSFKRLNLGMWLAASATSKDKLFDLAVWDRSAGLKPGDLHARTACVAVDMSATTDMTAAAAVFRTEPGDCREARCHKAFKAGNGEPCHTVLVQFWVPEAVLTSKQSSWSKAKRKQLAAWVDAGHVTVIPGEVIDDRDVIAGIHRWVETLDLTIDEIAIDKWQARQLRIVLEDEGFDVYEMPQSMAVMAEPTRRFIDAVTAARFHHYGNPVLRWMADNAVARVDTDGNKKPDKKKSGDKIDGIVTSIMALDASERIAAEATDSYAFTVGTGDE